MRFSLPLPPLLFLAPVLCCAACGAKGPLYLPVPPAAQPAAQRPVGAATPTSAPAMSAPAKTDDAAAGGGS